MQPLFRLAAALAASLPLLYGSPAVAAGTASAAISNLQLGTLDLTPHDGIAAGYEVGDVSAYLAAYIYTATTESLQETRPDPYQPGIARVEYGPSYGEARTSGALGDLATEAAAYPNLGDFGSAGAFAEQLVWLTLRPHTVLTVGGHFTALSSRVPDGGVDYDAYSRVLVSIADEQFNIATEMWRTSNVYPSGDMAHGLDEDFLLTYGNGSDHDLLVGLYLSTWSDVITLPAVPEPGTWAMLGAGLLLLGGAARSRRHG